MSGQNDYESAKALYELVKHIKNIKFVWKPGLITAILPSINFSHKDIHYMFWVHKTGIDIEYALLSSDSENNLFHGLHRGYGTVNEAISYIKNFLDKIDLVL